MRVVYLANYTVIQWTDWPLHTGYLNQNFDSTDYTLKDTNSSKIRTTFSIECNGWILEPNTKPGAWLLHLSHSFTCVYATGTKFGTN